MKKGAGKRGTVRWRLCFDTKLHGTRILVCVRRGPDRFFSMVAGCGATETETAMTGKGGREVVSEVTEEERGARNKNKTKSSR